MGSGSKEEKVMWKKPPKIRGLSLWMSGEQKAADTERTFFGTRRNDSAVEIFRT
jgi:hypothetical protein